MKKKLLLIGLIILVGLYFIPIPHPSFQDNYPQIDDISASLDSFKAEKIKSIQYNNKEWKYYKGGQGEKTIFFVHGMAGSYFLWWQQVEYFKKHYNIISYELPLGISSLEEASDGLLAILDEEKVDEVHIVGTSMGAYIAQYVIHKAPERIDKAVFGNSFPPNNDIKSKNKFKRAIAEILPPIILYQLRTWNFKKGMVAKSSKPELIEAYLKSVPFHKKQFKQRYQIVTDIFDSKANENAINKIPKLILECDNDPLVSKESREGIKKKYSNAQVFNFGNEGHIPCVSAAEKYNEVLLKFLKN